MAGSKYPLNDYSLLLLKTAIDSGITSPAELANIMGNAHVETGGFSTMHENFRYRSAKAIVAVVSSADDRFSWKQIEDAVASKDPRQVATIMYEKRKDLGNSEQGDGWRFHGRGYFQYTGRHNYTEYGRKFGVDLAGYPDMAADPEMAAKLAIAYWVDKVPLHKREDVVAAAYIINGGDNGKDARIAASKGWAEVISPQLVQDVQSGRMAPGKFDSESRHYPTVALTPRRGDSEVPTEAYSVLWSGQVGGEVRKLQQTLHSLGYTSSGGVPLKIDGDFGDKTEHAVRAFQRAHGLHVDGIVGRDTREALAKAERTPLLSERTHPDHALFRQAQQGLRQLPAGAFHGDREIDNTAAALAQKAREGGVSRIDHVLLNTRGDGVFAVQGDPRDPARHLVLVDKAQAAAQSVERSTGLVAAEDNSRLHAAQAQVQLQHQEHRAGLSVAMRP